MYLTALKNQWDWIENLKLCVSEHVDVLTIYRQVSQHILLGMLCSSSRYNEEVERITFRISVKFQEDLQPPESFLHPRSGTMPPGLEPLA